MADDTLTPDEAVEKKRAANRERGRRYRERHPEKLKERQREYDRRRPPRPPPTDAQIARKRAYNRDYMLTYEPKHPRVYTDEQKVRKTAYYLMWLSDPANKERVRNIKKKPVHRAKQNEWKRKQRKDPAKIEKIHGKDRIVNQRRRARLAKVENTFTKAEWQTLVARSKHCHWCKKPFTQERPPTHDHVIPLARGGGNTLTNSCCAHKSCNSRKNDGLFNPITGQGILL